MGHPELVLYQNSQRFDDKIYDGDGIISESFIQTQHIDKTRANWMQIKVESKSVVDVIKYLHIGLNEIQEFFSFEPTELGLSFFDDYENRKYKVAGFTIYRSLSKTIIQRTTYDLLAFLGDVGGLEAIIMVLGGAIVSYLTRFEINLKIFA